MRSFTNYLNESSPDHEDNYAKKHGVEIHRFGDSPFIHITKNKNNIGTIMNKGDEMYHSLIVTPKGPPVNLVHKTEQDAIHHIVNHPYNKD